DARLVTPSSSFAIATGAVVEGRRVQNANGEACGGTLVNAFAVSCNSVFVPLGTRIGGPRLVATAERFGFNQPTGIDGAQGSPIPSANQIGDSLEVGVSA